MTTPRFVVSLTTSPKRLPHIGKVIQSIYSQNVKPDKIYLNIPPIFKRTGESYPDNTPEELSSNFNNIVWNVVGEDVGPGTKLHGALQVIPEDEDVWIITIDDDILYLPGTIELYKNIIINSTNKMAMGLAGFIWHENNILQVDTISNVDVLEGYASVCYHRSFFKKSWITYFNKCIQDTNAVFSDDIIISNWLSLMNIPRLYISTPTINRSILFDTDCILPHGKESDALHKLNNTTNLPAYLTSSIRYLKVYLYLDKINLLGKHNVSPINNMINILKLVIYKKHIPLKNIPYIDPIDDNKEKCIPLKIYQTWNTNACSPYILECINNIKLSNPQFEYFLFGDTECREFIKTHFNQTVLDAYDCLIPTAYKADLWRYCVLYINGGIYLDIKYTLINNFNFMHLIYDEHWVLDVDCIGAYNALMVCKPKNLILLSCISKIVENVKNKYYGINSLDPTGPRLLGKFFKIEDKAKFDMSHHIDLDKLYNDDEYKNKKYISFNNVLVFQMSELYYGDQTKALIPQYGKLWKSKHIYYDLNIVNNKIHNNNEWTVLLTTAIDVNKQDVEYRTQLYCMQIERWITETNLYIYVVESTGNSEAFDYLQVKYPTRIHIIGCVIPYCSSSTVTEAKSIKNALDVINTTPQGINCRYILKVTGRYFLPYIENVIQCAPENMDVYTQIHKQVRIKWQNSEYYGIKKELFTQFIDSVLNNNVLMEHSFYSFITDNSLNSVNIGPFVNNIPRGGDNLTLVAL